MKKNLMGALALLGVVSLVVGCTALSGGKDSDVVITSVRRPELKVEQDIKPPQPAEEFMDDKKKGSGKFEITGRRLNPPDLPWPDVKAAKKDDCCCPTKKSATKLANPKGVCSPAPTASAVAPAPIPTVLVPPSAPVAKPLTLVDPPTAPASRSSKVGHLGFWDTFGYRVGRLVYSSPWPFSGGAKSVDMTEQEITLSYKCTALWAGTQHVVTVIVVAVVKPSFLWEEEYNRLIAAHGNGGNTVTKGDVERIARSYVGQHQEKACAHATAHTAKEFFTDSSLGLAEALNVWIRKDHRAPVEITVQTTGMSIPKELERWFVLQGLK